MTAKPPKATLLLAILTLCLGMFTAWTSHMSWYGVQEITGVQALVVGVLLVICGIGFLLSYIRQNSQK
jgi:hypothetical protein